MISHEHRCVFIHIPKTGGSSIEQAFLRNLNIAWEDRERLAMGRNQGVSGAPRRLSHTTACDLLKLGIISDEQFESYFKFSFVRNPWDRVVSFYKYLRIGGSFKRFACDVLPKSYWKSHYYFVRPQHEFVYDDNGECLMDFVGRFERLRDDFRTVQSTVGLTEELPHQNRYVGAPIPLLSRLRQVMLGSSTGNLSHIASALGPKQLEPDSSAYYDAESVEFIGDLYRKDVAEFGFKFPGRESRSAPENQWQMHAR